MKALITFLFVIISLTGYAQKKRIEPAYVIDGVVNANIRDFNPENIFDVHFLKGTQDTVKYGSNAQYGVAFITTSRIARKLIDEKISSFSWSFKRFIGEHHSAKITYILNDSVATERKIYYMPKEKIKEVEFIASATNPVLKIKSDKFAYTEPPPLEVYIRGER